jgi:thiol-disulfide isomerase/thioredoxin
LFLHRRQFSQKQSNDQSLYRDGQSQKECNKLKLKRKSIIDGSLIHPRTGVVLFIGVLFLAALLCLQKNEAAAKSQDSSGAKRLTVYEKAGDWSFKTLDGKPVAFSDFRGQVVFLNFWATWCVPCVEEMPGIEKLAKRLEKEDVAFLLITDEKEKKVRRFLEKHKLDLPIYIRGKKHPKTFKTKRLPITYILDRQGNIAMRRTGSTEWDEPVCEKFIRDLVKAKTP